MYSRQPSRTTQRARCLCAQSLERRKDLALHDRTHEREHERECDVLDGLDHPARHGLDQEREHGFARLGVRHVPLLGVQEVVLDLHAFAVRERLEAVLAVVRAHTRHPHAAERQLRVRQVHDRVVDRDAAGRRLGEHALAHRAVRREDVQRQRLCVVVHERNGVVERVVVVDRQERSEDLLRHRGARSERSKVGLEVQKRRRNVLGARIRHAAARHVALVGREQRVHARERAVVHDAAVRVARRGVFGKELGQLELNGSNECIAHALVHEHVVWADARLTGVEERTPRNAPRCDRNLRRLVDDARALAAELQDCRREVLRSRLGDNLPNKLAASAEDQVELVREHRARCVDAAAHCPHDPRVHVRLHERCEQLVRVDARVVAREAQEHDVARAERTNERRERELHGVVPRPDDVHEPERLFVHERLAWEVPEVRPNALGRAPVVDVVEVLLDLVQDHGYFHHFRLRRVLVQVFPERVAERVEVLGHEATQCEQLLLARADVARDAAAERTAQGFDVCSDRLGRRVVHSCRRRRRRRGGAA